MAERRCLWRVEILKKYVLDLFSVYGGSSLPLAGRYPHRFKILDCLSLYGGLSLPPAGRNSHKFKILDFLSPYGRSSLLCGGWKSSTNEDLRCFQLRWRAVAAPGASKSPKLRILDLSPYGRPSLPLAGRNPQQIKVLIF